MIENTIAKAILSIGENSPLCLEEHLHAFHILGGIEKIVLPLHHPLEQGNIVLALAQNVLHQVAGCGDGFLFGIMLFGVELVKELLIVVLLGFKGTQDKANQPVLIGGNVHRAQIVAQEVDALANQLLGGRNTPHNDGFVNLGLAQEDAAKLLAIIVLLVFSRQKESAAPHVWVLQCEDESAEDAAMRKLNEQLKKYVLKSNPGDAKGIEATIEVKLTGSKMKFLNELQRLDGVRHATLVSYNGEYMS